MIVLKIFCFPHAGGYANHYLFLKEYLPYDTILYEYDGHNSKFNKSYYLDFMDCIKKISSDIYTQLDDEDEFVFLGHSMGAYIAYMVAAHIQKEYAVSPQVVFVSGQVPPSEHENRYTYKLNNDSLVLYLKSIGGISSEIENHKSILYEFVLPSLRNDIKILEEFVFPVSLPKITSKLFVMYGRQDYELENSNMNKWEKCCLQFEGIRVFEGGHFYLDSFEVKQYIRNCLECSVKSSKRRKNVAMSVLEMWK